MNPIIIYITLYEILENNCYFVLNVAERNIINGEVLLERQSLSCRIYVWGLGFNTFVHIWILFCALLDNIHFQCAKRSI